MFNFDVFTKDPQFARKLLIGSLLALTGVGLLALVGWMLEIVRRVQAGESELPGFDEIGPMFIDGLKMMVVGFLWALPMVLLVVVLAIFTAFAPGLFASEDDAVLVLLILNLCIVGLVFIYIFPLLVLMIPAMGTLAETGSIRKAASLKKAVQIFRANPGGIIVAALLGTLVNSLLGSIGAMLCLVGVYPAFVVSYALQGQLFGAAYRDAKALRAG